MMNRGLFSVRSVTALCSLFLAFAVRAADVTVNDSLVSFAASGKKNYTFTDPGTGQSVTVAITITPFSPDPAATLVLLDGDTRVGVGNTNVGGDGNLIVFGEGVNCSASLVSASGGVTAGTVKFRLQSLGLRAVNGTPTLYWLSSATASNQFSLTGEALNPLDATNFLISSGSYTGRLGFAVNVGDDFQLSDAGAISGLGLKLNATFSAASSTSTGDPQIVSWMTTYSGLYARIYTNDLAKTNGISGTTWGNGQQNQTLPAYRGVQEISYSSNWVYLRTTGLGQYIMGPWYDTAARTIAFVNMPANQKALYRFPRTGTLAAPPAVKTATFGGVDVIGYFVDGVAMFDALDGFVWTGAAEGNGAGQWRRAAYPNEGVTFDPSFTHQQNTGVYHNHANPIALRYLLGDNVIFNPVTKAYTESTNAPTKHSPIIGWVRDGLPMYGPYGYSVSNNAASGVRRMVSGYVLRDGANGTDNLSIAASRSPLPAWTLRNNGNTAATGPAVSGTYPLGRYLQDYAYLGDLVNPNTGSNYVLGTHFDLNEFSARYCVTPEFPGGTWAYFINIDSNGTPVAPWVVGQFFMGNPTGNKWTNITDTVETNFTGGPNMTQRASAPTVGANNVTLTWSSVDGGTYQVESTTNLAGWSALRTNIASGGLLSTNIHTNGALLTAAFYKVSRTALANYDPVSGTATNGGGVQGISSVTPNSATRGQSNLALTITLNGAYVPAPPANTVQPTGASLTGPQTIPAISYTRNTNTGIVTATFNLTNGIPTGPYTINAIFGPNTWSLTNGFTVQ